MPRGKSSITRDSVFRRTSEQAAPPGQGITEEKQRHQTAIWLDDEEIDWLDERCKEIRRGGWRGITRSALIRSLIRAYMQKGVHLEGVSGEAELTERLRTTEP